MAAPAGFWHHVRVQFDHTDAQGRVFYARYFRLLDQARCAYWEALGCAADTVRQLENDTVIVHVEADYRGPAAFYDLLRITVTATHLGRSSLHLEYRVVNEQSGQEIVTARWEGTAQRVWGGFDPVLRAVPWEARIWPAGSKFKRHRPLGCCCWPSRSWRANTGARTAYSATACQFLRDQLHDGWRNNFVPV